MRWKQGWWKQNTQPCSTAGSGANAAQGHSTVGPSFARTSLLVWHFSFLLISTYLIENVLIGPGVSSSRCPQGRRDRSSTWLWQMPTNTPALLLRIFLASRRSSAQRAWHLWDCSTQRTPVWTESCRAVTAAPSPGPTPAPHSCCPPGWLSPSFLHHLQP